MKTKLKLVTMILVVVGLLAGGLTSAALASGPRETFTINTTLKEVSDLSITVRGDGTTVFEFNFVVSFPGPGIVGEVAGPGKIIFQLGGGFTGSVKDADFTGTINGESGTLKFSSTTRGSGECCIRGDTQFYDGTGDLEGVDATGTIFAEDTFSSVHTISVHFR